MASFAWSATTGGARKHAWTNLVVTRQVIELLKIPTEKTDNIAL